MSAASDPKTHMPYTIETAGFRTTFYSMVGQYGTHVDPPAHFAPDGITMDKIPLQQMILPLVVLDDTPYLAADPNHAFSVDDLQAWEKEHGAGAQGRRSRRCAPTCTRTGTPTRSGSSAAPSRPGRSRRSSSCSSSAA